MSARVAFFYARARAAVRNAREASVPSGRTYWLASAFAWRDLARQARARRA